MKSICQSRVTFILSLMRISIALYKEHNVKSIHAFSVHIIMSIFKVACVKFKFIIIYNFRFQRLAAF